MKNFSVAGYPFENITACLTDPLISEVVINGLVQHLRDSSDAVPDKFCRKFSDWCSFLCLRGCKFTLDGLLCYFLKPVTGMTCHGTEAVPQHHPYSHRLVLLHWPVPQSFGWLFPLEPLLSCCMLLAITFPYSIWQFGVIHSTLLWYYMWHSQCCSSSKLPAGLFIFTICFLCELLECAIH